MKKSLNKAHSNSRGSLFQYKEKQRCKRTHWVLTYHHPLRNSFNTIRELWASVEKQSKQYNNFPAPPMVAFKRPNSVRNLLVRAEMSKPSTTIGKSHSCGHNHCKCCRHMQHSSPVKSPENSTTYVVLLITRVQILFTFLSVQFVASNTLTSLSSPSTNTWMGTEVILQKSHFFLWASTSDCLTTVSRISTEWKSSSLNTTKFRICAHHL